MSPIPDTSGVRPFERVQVGWRMADAFPARDGICSCGCGALLTGRRRKWATDQCSTAAYREFAIVAGYSHYVRTAVFERDKGVCAACGVLASTSRWGNDWDADHIVPVHQGGGGCGLDNYQTLCKPCHKEKTGRNAKKRAASRKAGCEQSSLPLESA